MTRYIKYLNYLLRHKWFVFLECSKRGLVWRGIVHDISKFRPSEFIPYAKFFYNKDGYKRQIRDKTGYYKPDDTGDKAFDFAWFLHQKLNKHHWQWWCLVTSDFEIKALQIEEPYRTEMICDWLGAGRAQGTNSVNNWYNKNKDKMLLHKETRDWVEVQLKDLP